MCSGYEDTYHLLKQQQKGDKENIPPPDLPETIAESEEAL
jgi:hypothetical protein